MSKTAANQKPEIVQRRLVRTIDYWREDFRCYASQWGYRCGSEIARLIDFIRDEYQAKYGCDYRLKRVGKNKFLAVGGKNSDYGVYYAVEASEKFSTSVIFQPNAELTHPESKPKDHE